MLNEEKDSLIEQYCILRCSDDQLASVDPQIIVGTRKYEYGTEALIKDRQAIQHNENMIIDKASIEDVMLFIIKGGKQ